jgi:hypothetical protein
MLCSRQVLQRTRSKSDAPSALGYHKMPKYLTVSIRNLPLGTKIQDVGNHINSLVPDSHPAVGPLVPDSNYQTLSTSVTLQTESDKACEAARTKLHGSTFFPKNPERPQDNSVIVVSKDFLGPTTIAEHKDPQFEYARFLQCASWIYLA